MTTTTATTTATTSATTSITTTLGVGSGIDVTGLVQSLVDNSFAVKNKQLTTKADALTARISGLAKLKSGITGFDSALKSLVSGGTLATQPSSSNAGVVSVSALAGAKIGKLSANLRVETLAAAQAATSTTAVSTTAGFPAGTLAITMGSTTPASPPTATITVAQGATLDQIAAQINGQAVGITATVIGDGNGARLSLKGATGASQAFAIRATDDAAPAAGDPSLTSLAVNDGAGGMDVGSTATDAVVYLDGARFTRSSNTINNLLTGVRLDLKSTSPTAVTLGSAPPTSALSQAVGDFVETYNQLQAVIKEQIDPATGVLKTDTAVSQMARSLATLTTTQLTSDISGAPNKLADIGIGTNRDGTLAIDSVRLSKVMATYPAAVEAIFASGTGASGGGLSAALSAIATRVTDKTYGIDASTSRYTKQQTVIADQQTKATSDAATMKTRMTQQFGLMDAKVAAYKSTQTFLDNQIKAWNKSDS